jgi:DNA repair photolyase
LFWGGGHNRGMDEIPTRLLKGRGAVSNASSRYDSEARVRTDDGWGNDPDADPDLPPLRTSVMADASRTVIAHNKSPDIPFDQSLNPYRGCEHGCIYCYARPTHAYLGFSPGLDFETKLVAKFDAPAILERELRAKSYRCRPLAMGTNTDPYQPIERKYKITRGVLEVLSAYGNPVTIVTKSALVARDADILAAMAKRGLARVAISVTTLDADLARKMEPRAATPSRRLGAIRALKDAGVPVGVMVAPIIPTLTDPEMEKILEAAHAAGAESAGYVLLRLPLEIKDLFQQWLDEHEPGRARHVLSLIRQSRDGKLNDANFHSRFSGSGAYAELIEQRFHLATRRLGLNRNRWELDTSQFKPPAQAGDQLSLL